MNGMTQYASAQRSAPSEILARHEIVASQQFIRQLLDYSPDFIFILDSNRQIVFANRAAVELTVTDLDNMLGLRPGELLGCGHAKECNGCGTSLSCRYCGAINAILESYRQGRAIHECRALLMRDGIAQAVDFRVWASPFDLCGEKFTIFVLLSIEDEKRRRVLERLFFHDILNTATAIKGFVRLMNEGQVDDPKEVLTRIGVLSERIVEEILSQRMLLEAEDGNLSVNMAELESLSFLQGILQGFFKEDLLNTRHLALAEDSQSFRFFSDKALLGRALINMVKNGLEAALPEERVVLGCVARDGLGEFYVHNPGHMPEKIQAQIFKRSFSTKGPGRGIGTYSIKLFAEVHLGGKAGFTSSEEGGTRFFIRLPLERRQTDS